MGDKSNSKTTTTSSGTSTMWSNKPVKMRLFGAWEIGRTPSDCIPRLCSLNITRLTLNKSLGNDVGAIMVAVKMQNSKRMLRSNEISIPSFVSEQSSTFDIELDLYCELQYIHFIKRNRNYLQIFLQRRKKYKNKAILGFKTLACGLIDMLEVLQRSTISEKRLDLIGRVKESGKNDVIANITISSLKSQPIDQESNPRRGKISIDRPDVYSDDEEFTSAEDGSDSETIEEGNVPFRRKLNERKSRKQLFSNTDKFRSVVPTNVRQRNFKQKFISLLKKFRLPDSEAYDSEEKFQEALEKELMSSTQEPPDIDDLFDDEEIDDLDYLTDSGQEFDDVSISSTPKPSLRPFFSSCTLVGQDKSYEFPIGDINNRKDESQETSGTEGTPETSDTSQKQMNVSEESHNKKKLSFEKEPPKRVRLFPKERNETKNAQKEKKSLHAAMSLLSTTGYAKELDNTSKEFVQDQLNKAFSADDQSIPEEIIFLNLSECNTIHTQSFLQLFERTHRIVATNTLNDIKCSFNFLCNKIQKFCNNNMKILSPIRIALIGSDSYINSFLRFYVDSLAIKSPEWQNFLRFYIVPITYQPNQPTSMMLHKYLASIDSVYSNHFFTNPYVDQTAKDLDSSRISCANINININGSNALSEAQNIYMQEFYNKVVNFLHNAQTLMQIPIAEAMIAYKDKNVDDESNQVLIPFICDVKIGLADNYGNHSMEEEFSLSQTSSLAGMGCGDKFLTSPTSIKDHQQQQQQQHHHHSSTPPNSPSMTTTTTTTTTATTTLATNMAQPQQAYNKTEALYCNLNEAIDLQVDYWISPTKFNDSSSSAKKNDNCKFTLKNSFRNVQILRLPNYGETLSNSLTFSFVLKEKKQKIMRLGKKKEKDFESKCQVIEGIVRLVCSYKTSQSPIKAIVDGVEYSGVKFFQLTPQWQTQIKNFPVVIFSNNINNHQEKDSFNFLPSSTAAGAVNNCKAQQK